jgi:predicted  nucleic acid-binding Zn-ribbon protein
VDRVGPVIVEGAALNASSADQARLLDLQGLDSRLSQLAHRRSSLPELAELAGIAEQLREDDDQLVDLQTSRSDVAREATKLEQDIDQVRARSDRDQQRLDSGSITSAKDLESLQHEIVSLRRRQNELEEIELEILQRVEDLDHGLSSLQRSRVELEQRRGQAEVSRDAQFEQLDIDAAAARADRADLATQIPDELLTFYDKLRDQLGGVAVAALRQRRCDGCRLELNAIEVGRFRDAPDDAILRCEECRRVVVRTAESGL